MARHAGQYVGREPAGRRAHVEVTATDEGDHHAAGFAGFDEPHRVPPVAGETVEGPGDDRVDLAGRHGGE